MAKKQKEYIPEFKWQIMDLYNTGNYLVKKLWNTILTAKRAMEPLSYAKLLMTLEFLF